MSELTITGLFYYPIKACAGVSVPTAVLDAQGIRFDRRWMLTDLEGRFLTQREYPRLACIAPHATEEALTVVVPGLPLLQIPTVPDAALHRSMVTVWRFTGEALDEGEEAASWFSEAVGFPCRLVRTPEDFSRRVNPKNAGPEDRVSFADGYPLLIASEASLADLNAQLTERSIAPVPMERFRPNIVVSGASAWDEDHWRTLRDSDTGLTLRVASPCARCAVTTVDQRTGEKTGPEPLATLSGFRRTSEGKVNFALNLIHESHGPHVPLHVGGTLVVV